MYPLPKPKHLLWRWVTKTLISDFIKPKPLTSDQSFFRRILPRVVVAFDCNPKHSTFLIEHKVNGIINNTELFVSDQRIRSYTRNPFLERPEFFSVVGSCKQMIFFSSLLDNEEDIVLVDEDGKSFQQTQPLVFVWNHTSNLIKTLAPSLLPRPGRILSIDFASIGFGFEPKSRDHKLVCFLQFGDGKLKKNPLSYDAIEVYSVKNDTWKQITAPPWVVTPYSHLLTLHINGVHYWARDDILSFDFTEEKFGCIPLPHQVKKLVNKVCLADFHGSLAVILPYSVPPEDLTEQEKQMKQPFSVKIWVWNGETWDVGPRVAVGDFPVGDGIARAMGLFRNEYLFLQGCAEPELMLFNCKTVKLEKLDIQHDDLPEPTIQWPCPSDDE